MNRFVTSPLTGAQARRLVFRVRFKTQPLALPSLPRLTARLSLASPLSRTDMLRRATLDPDWRK
jgi:hypothetical protein